MAGRRQQQRKRKKEREREETMSDTGAIYLRIFKVVETETI